MNRQYIVNNQGKITKYYTKSVLCSFCGHRPEKGEKFVEGPAVYICARCVALCEKVLSKKTKDVPKQKYVPTDPTKKREIILCSFCGKDREEVRALFSGPGVHICNGCVDLCVAALSKQPKDTPVPKHVPIPMHRVFCSFCGHHPEKGRNMIAGPGVYICEPCVAFGAEAISLELKRNPEPKKAAEAKQPPVYPHGNRLCSFCGKGPEEARRIIPGPAVSICDKCVDLSVKIISGEWENAPGPKFKTFARLYRCKG